MSTTLDALDPKTRDFAYSLLDVADPLTAAETEVQRLKLVEAALLSRISGLQHEEEAAQRAVRYWQRKYQSAVARREVP
jgi:hypothetical protein